MQKKFLFSSRLLLIQKLSSLLCKRCDGANEFCELVHLDCSRHCSDHRLHLPSLDIVGLRWRASDAGKRPFQYAIAINLEAFFIAV